MEPTDTQELYCPPNMTRYDNTSIEYNPVFLCKICNKVLLSTRAARMHDQRSCNNIFDSLEEINHNRHSLILPNIRHECHICLKSFKRQIALKHHIDTAHKPINT